MNLPKISIVTPSFNQGEFIEETITSILDQNYPNLQYTIIDGGSSDNSISIIRKYSKYLNYWVSEKDTGQANAINKGLRHSSGIVFNWINSDDVVEKGALLKVGQLFSDPDVDLVAGAVNRFSTNSNQVVYNKSLVASDLMLWSPTTMYDQPGVWLRRKHFINCGGLDEQFHYAFDWDMLIRYLYKFSKVKYIEDVLVNYRWHDATKTVLHPAKFSFEQKRIIEKLATLDEFVGLRKSCKYKIKRTNWYDHLEATITDSSNRRLNKLKAVLFKLNEQPQNLEGTRATLGAIKRILIGQTEI